jgi:hypothetical protein
VAERCPQLKSLNAKMAISRHAPDIKLCPEVALKPSVPTACSVRDHLPLLQSISCAEALALSRFVHDLHERAHQVAALLKERELPNLWTLALNASKDLETLEQEFLTLARGSAPEVRTEAVCQSAGHRMPDSTHNSSDE